MAMPNGGLFWGKDGSNLTTFVKNGSIPEARLTDSKFQLFPPSAFVTNCFQWQRELLQPGINSVKT
jgi:hypothetical protein